MAALEVGKIFTPSSSAEVRDDFLTDLRLALLANGVAIPPIQPGTDNFILASALGELAMLQYANIAVSSNDANVLKATGTALDAIREALGLPALTPTPSSGVVRAQVVANATTTYVAGQQFVLPNGLRGKVLQNYVGVSDGALLQVITIDTGSATQLDAGVKIRWVNPPLNSKTEAVVQAPGLIGGVDVEDDARKRTRILNRLRNVPAGGNWAHMREIALNASASIQDCYIYPALGGPASVRVVPVIDFDTDNLAFTRAPTDAQLTTVRQALQSSLPDGNEVSVLAPRTRQTQISFVITIPDSALTGGNGQGWVDATPWPPLVAGDNNAISIGPPTAANIATISAQTSTAPIDGQAHIMWWSQIDQKFYTFLITAHSGSAGAWSCTFDRNLVSESGYVPNNDYVSPAAVNGEAYSKTFRKIMSTLGPQESTNDVNRLPRSLRHPLASETAPSDLSSRILVAFANAHSEVTNIAWGKQAVASMANEFDVSKGPGILIPQHFAIYKT